MTAGASSATVETTPDGRWLIDEHVVAADVRPAGRDRWVVVADGTSHEVAVLSRSPLRLQVDGLEVAVAVADERELAAARAGGAAGAARQEVRAPMPGLLKAVHVSEGDVVERGTPLVTLEAMKMENELAAAGRGRVTRVAVAAGTKVEGGALLVVVAAE
ncbi:MAG TPA: acetyl-CoA carboxylase biotin carboxyl carrier protein subunit [Candidatus Limnocylindria bacterium]|nr:acetyl-CoA carboxylase biotin carboxyl carrier protein subunit [Candidatus Limnocylindria bacterium]